ncbi:pilus assembly protein [Photobacterium japonica]|uniref:TadE/TadG family type IV pilus assembly protein n=1 Tax=Photobacterium japonica TaxID=2910235 RepID=UPI003D09AC56
MKQQRMCRRRTGPLRLQRQQGVAAVWMALMLVPIMGFTFWAVEGTRYVQAHSRLQDATEAASLAVTMSDDEDHAKAMAEDYIRAYVRDIDGISVTVKRKHEEGNINHNVDEYIQYTVDATTRHRSWFSSTLIPSFAPKQSLAGESVAKKYPEYLGDRDIDIVFVSDFSGSMNNRWQGHSQLYWLKRAINQITDKILVKDETDNVIKNRVAFVPYNLRVQDKIDGSLICNSQLRYNTYNSGYWDPEYEAVDWTFWAQESSNDVYYCNRDSRYCPGRNRDEREYYQKQARQVYNVINSNRNWHLLDIPNYIDYRKSVSDLFTNKITTQHFHYNSSHNRLYSEASMCSTGRDAFWTIGLTSHKSALDAVGRMDATGGTGAYQGILRGAQVMAAGRPHTRDKTVMDEYNERLKMILILSDGQESPYSSILPNLVNNGMCDRIRSQFSDSDMPLYIGVVGINFRASGQSGFKQCVLNPKEDIIDVNNVNDLIDKIEELIKKGSRSSGVTKLYG